MNKFNIVVTESLRSTPDTYVLLGYLRSQLRMTKSAFDKALWNLIDQGNVYPVHHNHPHSLTQSERNQMITDSHGDYYFAVAARDVESL